MNMNIGVGNYEHMGAFDHTRTHTLSFHLNFELTLDSKFGLCIVDFGSMDSIQGVDIIIGAVRSTESNIYFPAYVFPSNQVSNYSTMLATEIRPLSGVRSHSEGPTQDCNTTK